MMQFDYTIHNPLRMDFRHAGLLSKLAKRYADTTITVAKGNQAAKAGQLIRMMGLSIKSGVAARTIQGHQTVYFLFDKSSKT